MSSADTQIRSSAPSRSSTYLDVKFPVQQYVLCLQIMMQEGRIHVVKKVNPQRNLVQNPESQRPAQPGVGVFLQEEEMVKVITGVLMTLCLLKARDSVRVGSLHRCKSM